MTTESQTLEGQNNLERLSINVVRALAMDAVQRANSGHPGTPMALAPLADVLWTRVMTYDAADPQWPDRDRFVLSAGHASMLLYSMLYLTGFGLELDDIRQFRQWGSLTPGHPEYGHTIGVEVTTGPLGQGVGDAVGIALAEKHMRARFGPDVCDHHVFGICGDGDMMEGISHEAASLAGHLQLGRLVFVYDDNHITIDGDTVLAYSDDVAKRFEAYGWHVQQLGEASEDPDALEAGLRAGMAEERRPSLVIVRSHIGYPSPKVMDSAAAHGSPLGADEVARGEGDPRAPRRPGLLRSRRGARASTAPRVTAAAPRRGRRGRASPECVGRREPHTRRRIRGVPHRPPARRLGAEAAGLRGREPRSRRATPPRMCSSAVMDLVPGLIVGSADLTGNTGMAVKGAGVMEPNDATGRGIHYGIREHGMSAAANGMAVSGLLPTVGTFFVFSDYGRPSVRLASLMHAKVAFTWTHDSVAVGEDGPTHEPVEQLASFRAMPGLRVIRPADANEVAAAWRVHIDGTGPTAHDLHPAEGRRARRHRGAGCGRPPRGAYTLVDEGAAGPRSRAHRHGFGGRGWQSRRRRPSPSAASRCGSCRCRRGSSSPSSPTSTARRCCLPTVRRSRSRPA